MEDREDENDKGWWLDELVLRNPVGGSIFLSFIGTLAAIVAASALSLI